MWSFISGSNCHWCNVRSTTPISLLRCYYAQKWLAGFLKALGSYPAVIVRHLLMCGLDFNEASEEEQHRAMELGMKRLEGLVNTYDHECELRFWWGKISYNDLEEEMKGRNESCCNSVLTRVQVCVIQWWNCLCASLGCSSCWGIGTTRSHLRHFLIRRGWTRSRTVWKEQKPLKGLCGQVWLPNFVTLKVRKNRYLCWIRVSILISLSRSSTRATSCTRLCIIGKNTTAGSGATFMSFACCYRCWFKKSHLGQPCRSDNSTGHI